MGKGIGVCKRWEKFENFFADMGPKPSKAHSIDRLDNSKGYSPENCAWRTAHDQAHNRDTPTTNTSGYIGVYQGRRGRWKAFCTAVYTNIHLGTFDTIEEAASARQQAEAKIKRLGEDALKAMTLARLKVIIRGW
jgi:hypothetical protein